MPLPDRYVVNFEEKDSSKFAVIPAAGVCRKARCSLA